MKHPVIIPRKNHMTNLIIQNCHRQQGHCGPSQALVYIWERFWIVRGLTAVRRVSANCINCRKQNARPGEQIMAPLPSARVAPTDPLFTYVGVDYFGPLFVKQGLSQVKHYDVCLHALPWGRCTLKSRTHWKQTPLSVHISAMLVIEGSLKKHTTTTAPISRAPSKSWEKQWSDWTKPKSTTV